MIEACKISKLQTNRHRPHNTYPTFIFSDHFDEAYLQTEMMLHLHLIVVMSTPTTANQTAYRDSGSDPSIIYKTDTSDFGGINWLQDRVGWQHSSVLLPALICHEHDYTGVLSFTHGEAGERRATGLYIGLLLIKSSPSE